MPPRTAILAAKWSHLYRMLVRAEPLTRLLAEEVHKAFHSSSKVQLRIPSSSLIWREWRRVSWVVQRTERALQTARPAPQRAQPRALWAASSARRKNHSHHSNNRVIVAKQQPFDSAEPVKFQPSDRKSTRLNSSHMSISYAVFCLKKKI